MKTIQILVFLFCSNALLSQQIITLRNPSFEDLPRCCKAPQGWEPCGKEGLNTPDVQPGYFNVNLAPLNGNTYIGMVTRDNDSWESIAQLLNHKLQSGKRYWFSIFLAQSPQLISQSRLTGQGANYTEPIKLRIWGGNNYCHKSELLAETPLIDHNHWKKYEFVFEPGKDHHAITFEAFYKTPSLAPYNGHLLMDHCSAIMELNGVEDTAHFRRSDANDTLSVVNIPDKIIKEEKKAVIVEEMTTEDMHWWLIKKFRSKGFRFEEPDTSSHISGQLYLVWELENKVLRMGIRNYIYVNSASDASEMGNSLMEIGFKESATVIFNTVDIFSKNENGAEITKAEYRYFNQSDRLLNQTFREEKEKDLILDYISAHREALVRELKAFSKN